MEKKINKKKKQTDRIFYLSWLSFPYRYRKWRKVVTKVWQQKETLTQVFSCNFWEIYKSTFFTVPPADCFCLLKTYQFFWRPTYSHRSHSVVTHANISCQMSCNFTISSLCSSISHTIPHIEELENLFFTWWKIISPLKMWNQFIISSYNLTTFKTQTFCPQA